MYIKYPHFVRRNVSRLSLGAACIIGSFFVGMHTAGDVRPVSLIEAGGSIAGDIDGNGTVDIRDALSILEITQGYQAATVDQLKADPNRDGVLTVDDAITILTTLSLN